MTEPVDNDEQQAGEGAAAAEAVAAEHVRGTRGHVLAAQVDERLALWTVGTAGQATGAWVIGTDLPRAEARRRLTLVERRLVVDVGTARSSEALGVLLEAGQMPDVALPTGTVSDLVDEVEEFRAVLVPDEDVRRQVFGDGLSATTGDPGAVLETLGRVVPRPPEPAARPVLEMVAVLRWVVEAWQETERVRMRRKEPRERYGKARPLPDRWLQRLRDADATRLDLHDVDA